jgi:hypothetical protein
MPTYSGYLFTGVPEYGKNADTLLVYTSDSSSGSFTVEEALGYTFPTKVTEYNIDSTKFYKIAYSNSTTGYLTPQSDAVDGSTILKSAPGLEISSTADGAPFATAQNVYDRSNMTEADVSTADVNYALSVARAFIDLKLSSISINRFSSFPTQTAQRKFNAMARLMRDAELNYALSLVYRHMADDKILTNLTANTKTSNSVSVGQTSIAGIEGGDSLTTANYFDALSIRYLGYATDLMNTLVPNYVPLRYSENGTGYVNRFISFSGDTATFNFAAGIILDRMDL